jgi:hypothetical protein
MSCSVGLYNARRSRGQTEKARVYISHSRIDFIRLADLTCQADTVRYKKYTEKYSKITPVNERQLSASEG